MKCSVSYLRNTLVRRRSWNFNQDLTRSVENPVLDPENLAFLFPNIPRICVNLRGIITGKCLSNVISLLFSGWKMVDPTSASFDRQQLSRVHCSVSRFPACRVGVYHVAFRRGRRERQRQRARARETSVARRVTRQRRPRDVQSHKAQQ